MQSFLRFFYFCFLFVSPIYGKISQNQDFQLWLFNSWKWKVGKGTSFILDTELRYGDNASQAYYSYLQSQLEFTLCPEVIITPGYRQDYLLRFNKKKWEFIYAPFFEITLIKKRNEWDIKNRGRLFYFLSEIGKPQWQYRHRLHITSPWKWGTLKFTPWIYDEVFFTERIGLSQNRFSVGGYFFLNKNKNIKFDPEFMLRYLLMDEEELRSTRWRVHYVYRLALRFLF